MRVYTFFDFLVHLIFIRAFNTFLDFLFLKGNHFFFLLSNFVQNSYPTSFLFRGCASYIFPPNRIGPNPYLYFVFIFVIFCFLPRNILFDAFCIKLSTRRTPLRLIWADLFSTCSLFPHSSSSSHCFPVPLPRPASPVLFLPRPASAVLFLPRPASHFLPLRLLFPAGIPLR